MAMAAQQTPHALLDDECLRAGDVIGAISGDGHVFSLDSSRDFLGVAVAARAVRDPGGALVGTFHEASRTVRDAAGCVREGARVAGALVTTADGDVIGVVQGLPPPLCLVHRRAAPVDAARESLSADDSGSGEGSNGGDTVAAGEHVGVVAWATLEATTLDNGERIGVVSTSAHQTLPHVTCKLAIYQRRSSHHFHGSRSGA